MKSLENDDKALAEGSLSRMDNASKACMSPIPVAKEIQTPKLSNSSNSKDWLLDSEVKPETVELQCKFRRLRKLGDLKKKIPSESREQTGPRRKLRTSRGTDYQRPTKLAKG